MIIQGSLATVVTTHVADRRGAPSWQARAATGAGRAGATIAPRLSHASRSARVRPAPHAGRPFRTGTPLRAPHNQCSAKRRSSLCPRSSAQAEGAAAEATDEDRSYMRQAIELARTAEGKTYPNPMVGCIIVKDGVVVGTGYHPRAGEPHAEVFALRAAGSLAQGATAYVSLEPCNHYGRTPPCSQAMVDAAVSRVVVGMVDPDPRVSGGGLKTLTDAGIEVVCVGGEEEAACKELNTEFITRVMAEREASESGSP